MCRGAATHDGPGPVCSEMANDAFPDHANGAPKHGLAPPGLKGAPYFLQSGFGGEDQGTMFNEKSLKPEVCDQNLGYTAQAPRPTRIPHIALIPTSQPGRPLAD